MRSYAVSAAADPALTAPAPVADPAYVHATHGRHAHVTYRERPRSVAAGCSLILLRSSVARRLLREMTPSVSAEASSRALAAAGSARQGVEPPILRMVSAPHRPDYVAPTGAVRRSGRMVPGIAVGGDLLAGLLRDGHDQIPVYVSRKAEFDQVVGEPPSFGRSLLALVGARDDAPQTTRKGSSDDGVQRFFAWMEGA